LELEEVKELSTKYGDAFNKGLLLGAVANSLGFGGMFAAVATNGLVDWQRGGGVGRLFGNEGLLREVRERFQQWFLALVKNPESRRQMYEGKVISEVGPSGSQGQIKCDNIDFLLHSLDAPDCPQKEVARIYEHIDACKNCLLKYGLYKMLFPEGLGERSRWYVQQITSLLCRHFSLMRAEVGCGTVRRFLPLLADNEREILIDTPVTAHVDYCQDCRNDLELLRELRLSSEQADRLADLYGQRPLEGSDDCERFSEAIGLIAKMRFDKVGEKALDHIRQCKRCRDTLRNKRAGAVFAAGRADSAQGPCETVETGDLLDHCVLFAGIGADERLSKDSMELSRHIARCRTCLQKMFRMHGAIFGAAGRGESGVVTWYDYPTAAKRKGFTYVSSFNVRVGMNLWVRGRSQDGPQAEPKAGGWSERVKRLAGRPGRRTLVSGVAAAIVSIVIGLMLLPLTADGRIALGEVYQAIADIQNVFMSRFVPGKEEPTRIEYVSKSLGIKLFDLEDRIVLRDLENGIMKIKDRVTAEITTTPISLDKLIEFRENLEGTLGLVPFPDTTRFPEDAEWTHVADDQIKDIIPGTEIYDLTWAEDAEWLHKWRLFVERSTHLPHKVERYPKLAGEAEYTFYLSNVVRYISESEIEDVIREAFE
jgi:hypothetical protein